MIFKYATGAHDHIKVHTRLNILYNNSINLNYYTASNIRVSSFLL